MAHILPAAVTAAGKMRGRTTTLLVGLYSQARIYLAIGRDGLLPAAVGRADAVSGAPVAAQLLAGGLALPLAALLDIHQLASILSIGILAACVPSTA